MDIQNGSEETQKLGKQVISIFFFIVIRRLRSGLDLKF